MASRQATPTPARVADQDALAAASMVPAAKVILPDGGYGWVIMFAAFFCNFFTDGIMASFGQFMTPLSVDLGVTPSAVSLVGALLVGVCQILGPLSSGIANRYGFRVSIFVGSLVSSAGFGLSYFATDIELLCCLYGVVGGLGFALIYVPSSLAVNFYFTRWRALATGVSLSGFNMGGVVLPLTLAYAIAEYGWRNAMLIEAAISLCGAMIGLLFRPPPTESVGQLSGLAGTSLMSVGYSLSSNMRLRHNRDYVSVLDMMGEEAPRRAAPRRVRRGGCLACLKRFFCCDCLRSPEARGVRPFYRDDIFYDGSCVHLQQYHANRTQGDRFYHFTVTRMASEDDILEELQHRCVMIPHAFSRTLATMLDLSLLRTPPMMLQILSCMFAAMAFYTPYIYLPALGVSMGMTTMQATLYVTAISGTAVVGRFVCAGIASLACTNHFYLQSVTQTLGGTAILLCGFPIGHHGQMACCAIYGLSIAFYSNLRSIILVDLVGLQNLTNAFGLIMLFQGIGFTLGPPLAGLIFEASGNSDLWVLRWAGGTILLSALLTYPLDQLRRRAPAHDIVHARKR